jgi:murein DD-endopeptidase MepM/ murein hydrolase activator NlpD
MLSLQRSTLRAVCAISAASLIATAGVVTGARSTVAHAASVPQLHQKISSGENQISNLAGAVSAASGRLSQLNESIAGLEQRIGRLQAYLDDRRAELLRVRAQLDAARVRLANVQAFAARAEGVLAAQLVNTYEADRPDLITVVLESTGFQDLLEQLSFAERIRKQDVRVTVQVRSARRAVAAQATRLGALEVRQQALMSGVLAQRNGLASVRVSLIQQQLAVAQARREKAGELAGVQSQVAGLKSHLSKLQAAQAAAAAQASAAGSSSGSPTSGSSAGASGPGAGGFVFPLPKSAASPPATWSPDDGVDISAPGDTPEYAVCSGTIVLRGIGGFGPWAPVLHCDSSIEGYSYVYYGHAGPANQLPVGTHVSAGQMMSSIGPGIVGISTGPHVEMGFADSSGNPIGPSSASTMMSLLQSAYGA